MAANTPVHLLEERYVACMVLSGVGDALGFKNGEWEFCHSGERIHEELKELGGLENIKVKPPKWLVSDDTVMHIATAKALVEDYKSDEKLFSSLAREYKKSMKDMAGRSPGPTCMNSCHLLKPKIPGGYRIPFDLRGGGCGAAMRAMCIGLRFPCQEDIDDLIKVSVESGRMTHNHPTGYLGSFVAALFTAYSVCGKPVKEWGKGMMDLLPKVQKYIKNVNVDVEENLKAWDYFNNRWADYLVERRIKEGRSEPVFPGIYGIKERDAYYKKLSFNGWGGASGHDAPMIAYDALLGYDGTWEDLCSRSMFHSGDSDSTGTIAAAWYGAMFGFKGMSDKNHMKLEKRADLVDLAQKLYKHVIGKGYLKTMWEPMGPPMVPQQDYESPTYIIRKSPLIHIFTLDKAGSKYERNNDVDYEILDKFFGGRCRVPSKHIVKHGNATYSEITDCIEGIDGSKHDGFFFIFLSFLDEKKSTKRGTMGSLSVKCDRGESRESVQVSFLPEEIIGMVKKKHSLALKPKIFIFQADDNSLLPTKMKPKGGPTSDVNPTRKTIPTDADQLVIISTLPQKLANLFETEGQLPASSEKRVHAQPSDVNPKRQKTLTNPSLLISAMVKILDANNDKDVFTCTPLINGEVMKTIETLHINMKDVPGEELPVPLVYSTLTKCLNFYNERDYEYGL